jgi:hypothetical protein
MKARTARMCSSSALLPGMRGVRAMKTTSGKVSSTWGSTFSTYAQGTDGDWWAATLDLRRWVPATRRTASPIWAMSWSPDDGFHFHFANGTQPRAEHARLR